MKEKSASIDMLFIIVLLCAFTASVLLVLLLGARVYGSSSKVASESYNRRTCAAYISEKLRHGDASGAVASGTFDGCSALTFTADVNGSTYCNILYYYDGWLRELTCEEGAAFRREDGDKIVETGPVSFSEPESGSIKIEIAESDGRANGIIYHLRSGGTA